MYYELLKNDPNLLLETAPRKNKQKKNLAYDIVHVLYLVMRLSRSFNINLNSFL